MNLYLYERTNGNYNRNQEMENYMDFRDQLRYMGERDFQERNRVPEWVRAERMEMTVPLNDLWKYPDSFAAESLIKNIFKRITSVVKTKKEMAALCHTQYKESSLFKNTQKEVDFTWIKKHQAHC